MNGKKLAAALTLAAILAGAGAVAAAARWPRLRHLAVPTLEDPSLQPAAERLSIAARPACQATALAKLPGRVAALLQVGGMVWAGGFDTGVFKLEPRGQGLAPVGVLGIVGRERFVNALAAHGGRVFAATYAGILEIAAEGKLERRHLRGIAVEALLETDDGLLAGTTEGLYLLRGGDFQQIDVADASGSSLRVTALAEQDGWLWLGTPSGVYSIPREALRTAGPYEARWHPLVFGEHAARTNVVLSLVPWGRGVLAGTDDGGLVEIDEAGAHAFELDEPRANEANSGAAARLGDFALFGTQGGGLIFASTSAEAIAVARPVGWEIERVSAVTAGERLIVGGDDGRVVALECR